ncbi:MAG TPA: RT0821/Lpp0805 family surface protein [Alphaproteobacteria bacterium]|nr:RT0821/Lpp0805 family surface protein [Alphaproteobacteria bacterium]
MNKLKRVGTSGLIGAMVLTATLDGCAQKYSSPQEAAAHACTALGPRAMSGALIGTAAGAVGGAALGSMAGSGRYALIGAAAGALVGLVAGLVAGHSADQRDCAAAQAALQKVGNAPTNDPVSWSAPTGSHGLFTPVSDQYTAPSGQICRKIQSSYYMDGHSPVTGEDGIVCRTADGDWARLQQ